MKYDWDDILWEAEFEPGKIYQARVTYFDGYQEVSDFKYLGPKLSPKSVNGFEYLVIPEFQALYISSHSGHARMLEVIAVD